jgi:ParB family chromosome partitioning protein
MPSSRGLPDNFELDVEAPSLKPPVQLGDYLDEMRVKRVDQAPELPTDRIRPDPSQPRKDLGDLTEFKASIAKVGIIEPIVVSPDKDGGYLIIAGERRWTAAKQLGLRTIPAIVREADEHERLKLQIIENIFRKDLDPFEEAESYKRLQDEFNLTQEGVAEELGKSVSSVNDTLRLLDLPRRIREEFRTSGKGSKSLLLEIVREPEKEVQLGLWEEVKRGELTVKKARARKKGEIQKTEAPAAQSLPRSMTFRYPITTHEAEITLTFERPSATLDDIIAALEEALEGERARRG